MGAATLAPLVFGGRFPVRTAVGVARWFSLAPLVFELELELIQTQMTQKPMLRAEVYARALRASQNRKEDSL